MYKLKLEKVKGIYRKHGTASVVMGLGARWWEEN